MSVLHDAIHRMRKPRICAQCRRLIQVGEMYRKQVNTFDGFQVYEAHSDCDEAARYIYENGNLPPYEYIILADVAVEVQDRPFLTEKYPAVAARLWGER